MGKISRSNDAPKIQNLRTSRRANNTKVVVQVENPEQKTNEDLDKLLTDVTAMINRLKLEQ